MVLPDSLSKFMVHMQVVSKEEAKERVHFRMKGLLAHVISFLFPTNTTPFSLKGQQVLNLFNILPIFRRRR
jgi:hypothetical protein